MLTFTVLGVLSLAIGKAFASNDDRTPSQMRLAYAGEGGMMVSWNTPSKLQQPTVLYGTSPNHLNHVATSEVSVTYPTSTTYNNHVMIKGLAADMLYFYRPEDANTTYTFRTARRIGDTSPFEVAVVVDLGTMGNDGLTTHVGKGASSPLKPGEINTIQSVANSKSEFDFVWHVGDIAYADYWLKEEIQGFLPNTTIEEGSAVYERILNDFYIEMSSITATKPYMVGPGNHEANCDNGGTTDKAHNISYTADICMPGQTNFTGYRNHFRMPSAESGGVGNFWYSFDLGMAHFVQLDTETDLGHGIIAPDEVGDSENEESGPFGNYMNQQLDWLQKDLAAVDRKKTPWVVVGGHRPWYVSAKNTSSSLCWDCKNVFEPILMEYGVDLVMSGHVHAYERNAPIFDSKADPAELNDPKAPWYISNGAAGHYDGLDSLIRPLPSFSRYAQDTAYGWSRLKFHNTTHLTHEFVASGNGTVLDSATLYKSHRPGQECGHDKGHHHGSACQAKLQ